MEKKTAGMMAAVMIVAACTCSAFASMNKAEEGYPVPAGSFLKGTDAAVMYGNNETIWIPSGHQMIEEMSQPYLDRRYGRLNNHYIEDFTFTIQRNQSVYLMTPLLRPIRHNGNITVLRNITFRLRMPVGVNITEVGVSGVSRYLYLNTVVRPGTGLDRNYVVDMGSRRALPEPLQAYLLIRNDLSKNMTVNSYGAWFVQEW